MRLFCEFFMQIRHIFHIIASVLIFCIFSVGCAASKKEIAEKKQVDMDYEMAVNYFNAGETSQAIRSLALVLATDPTHAEANHLMGFIRMGRRQYDEAVTHFKKALETNPNMLNCKNNLGAAYMYQERWEDAAIIFEELSKSPLYTSPWLAFVNLGWAYYKMGMIPEAYEQTEMSVFLNPKFCLGLNNMGIIEEEMGREESALKHYEEALANCSNYPEPNLHLGLIYAHRGESAKAYKYFKRCHELTPKSELGERCLANAETMK